MFSISELIKNAYAITKSRPVLWLLGMFVVGIFNLNFFHPSGWPREFGNRVDLPSLSLYFQAHPVALAAASFSLLCVSLGSLLLTNWSRIMLLLVVKSLLDKRRLDFVPQLKRSKNLLWPVIKVSLLTSVFMLGALAALAAPWWLNVDSVAVQTLLWILGGMIFFPLAFTISCVNIFTVTFMVLLGLPVAKALDAGTDFFVANWAQILGLALVLIVIYLACYVLGTGLIVLARALLDLMLLGLTQTGFLHVLGLFIIIKALGAILLWVLLGILNAFLNTALLLFFLQKVTPVKTEQKAEVTQAVPSPALT